MITGFKVFATVKGLIKEMPGTPGYSAGITCLGKAIKEESFLFTYFPDNESPLYEFTINKKDSAPGETIGLTPLKMLVKASDVRALSMLLEAKIGGIRLVHLMAGTPTAMQLAIAELKLKSSKYDAAKTVENESALIRAAQVVCVLATIWGRNEHIALATYAEPLAIAWVQLCQKKPDGTPIALSAQLTQLRQALSPNITPNGIDRIFQGASDKAIGIIRSAIEKTESLLTKGDQGVSKAESKEKESKESKDKEGGSLLLSDWFSGTRVMSGTDTSAKSGARPCTPSSLSTRRNAAVLSLADFTDVTDNADDDLTPEIDPLTGQLIPRRPPTFHGMD